MSARVRADACFEGFVTGQRRNQAKSSLSHVRPRAKVRVPLAARPPVPPRSATTKRQRAAENQRHDVPTTFPQPSRLRLIFPPHLYPNGIVHRSPGLVRPGGPTLGHRGRARRSNPERVAAARDRSTGDGAGGAQPFQML